MFGVYGTSPLLFSFFLLFIVSFFLFLPFNNTENGRAGLNGTAVEVEEAKAEAAATRQEKKKKEENEAHAL